MKTVSCLALCMILLFTTFCAQAQPDQAKVVLVERSDVLDSAFSFLDITNPLLAKYNEITGAGVEGSQVFCPCFFDTEKEPLRTSKDMGSDQIASIISAGEYLLNNETDDLLICIGTLTSYGYESGSAATANESLSCPLFIHKDDKGVHISALKPDMVFPQELTIDVFTLDGWNNWSLFGK